MKFDWKEVVLIVLVTLFLGFVAGEHYSRYEKDEGEACPELVSDKVWEMWGRSKVDNISLGYEHTDPDKTYTCDVMVSYFNGHKFCINSDGVTDEGDTNIRPY